MPLKKGHHLKPVVAMVDQLVDLTIDFLVFHTDKPEQVVLNISREQALRKLQALLHSECDKAVIDGDKVWCLISIITATVIAYVMETTSDSISYNFCSEWTLLPMLFVGCIIPLTATIPVLKKFQL